MTPISVRYRAASGNVQMVLLVIAVAMSAGLTIGAIGSLLASRSLAWTIGLSLAAPLSWWAMVLFARAVRARRAAISAGTPALVADESGLRYLDWEGASKQLEWARITGFRLVDIVNEGPWLYVDGDYPHALLQPIRFPIRDLEADGEGLLRDLERMREARI